MSQAKAEGRVLGGASTLCREDQETIRRRRAEGTSLGILAKESDGAGSAMLMSLMFPALSNT